jgi:hypothetical protein
MKLRILAAAAAFAVSGAAHAALLDGETLNYQYFFASLGSPYGNAPNGDYVVGPGVEIVNFVDGTGGDIDISDTQIAVAFTDVQFNSGTFNGFRLMDVFGTIDTFTSVSIDASSTASIDPGRVSFDGDNVWVNFQSLSFSAGETLVLNVTGVNAIPEPETYALMLLGLAGVGAMVRRRKHSA